MSWGKTRYRHKFKENSKINKHNLKALEDWLVTLDCKSRKSDVDHKSIVFDSVDSSKINDLIECLELPEDAFGNEAVQGFINKIWNIAPDFPKFRVVLSSTKSTRKMRWENASSSLITKTCQNLKIRNNQSVNT